MTAKEYDPIINLIIETATEDRRFMLLCDETSLSPRALMIEFFKVYEPDRVGDWQKRLIDEFFAWVDFNLSEDNEVNDFHELHNCFDEANFDEAQETDDE